MLSGMSLRNAGGFDSDFKSPPIDKKSFAEMNFINSSSEKLYPLARHSLLNQSGRKVNQIMIDEN